MTAGELWRILGNVPSYAEVIIEVPDEEMGRHVESTKLVGITTPTFVIHVENNSSERV